MIETVIRRTLKCKYCIGSGICYKQYSVSWKKLPNAHLIFYYVTSRKCFVVWNASVLQLMNKKTAKANFYFESELSKLLFSQNFSIDNIKVFDKQIHQEEYKGFYEKNVLVPESKLFEFCENYEEYIYPSEEDLRHRKYLFALPNSQKIIELTSNQDDYSEVIRERDRVSRARRDPDFRDRVLKKYNYNCIVCGCKEPAILEAAHIKGVAEGGDDSTDNGICLCRNHHKLYDAALLDIDFKNGVFVCKSKEAMKMPWYKEAHSRNYQLVGIENGD